MLAGTCFVWQWRRGGHTPPIKTWHLRGAPCEGGATSLRWALLRYCRALAGLLALGAGFAWATLERDHQFLHDRLAGTRILKDQR